MAGKVEVHDMVIKNQVMEMRHMTEGLTITKGRTMQLKPGSYHIMLMDLKQHLKGGDTVPLTLHFEALDSQKTFQQEVNVPVTALGASNLPPGDHGHGHKPAEHKH